MAGGVKKQMIDTSIGLPTVDIGGVSFASGNKEKKIYSLGFDAAVDLVMEYWAKGEDMDIAVTNIKFIKETLLSNNTWGKEKDK